MPPYGGEGDKLKWVCRKIGKYCIDNICPPMAFRPSKNNKNILTGYTKQNMLVNFNDDKERPCQIGDLIQVKITKAYSWHLFGEVLK